MTDEVNLVLRSKVLYCTLNIENAINNLLAKHLLIKDKSKTKNFSNKAGIPFQSKITLLFDIDVLSKEEFLAIDLLMNIRNKFLHDIKYSSFEILLQDFAQDIRNRFLKHLDNGEVKNEEVYEKAFNNLYQVIVDIINQKMKIIDNDSNKKIKYLKFQMELVNKMIVNSLDFISELNLIAESTTDINTKTKIQKAKLKFEYDMSFKENIEKIREYSNEELIKSLIK